MTIDLMDDRTIPCIQDMGASPMEDPSYHSRGLEMESHFCQNDNSEVNLQHVVFILKVV